MSQIEALDLSDWTPALAPDVTQRLARSLESGKVLLLPQLDFDLNADERVFLDPRWSQAGHKNISYDAAHQRLKGAAGTADECARLRQLLQRFHQQARGLIAALLPAYVSNLKPALASFRPLPVAGRASSWRKDDSRLHVDAFPSRPNRGERILRVFANVNPHGEPRVWRVGEPFAEMARCFLPRLPPPQPRVAALLHLLGITKSRRSAYDHYMLHLHDAMKADAAYQRSAPQERVAFPPGCVWICFSDQTSHAVMSGQYLLEQTLHLPVTGLYDAASSPLRVLENLVGHRLV